MEECNECKEFVLANFGSCDHLLSYDLPHMYMDDQGAVTYARIAICTNVYTEKSAEASNEVKAVTCAFCISKRCVFNILSSDTSL